jgi:hypothetical protein
MLFLDGHGVPRIPHLRLGLAGQAAAAMRF